MKLVTKILGHDRVESKRSWEDTVIEKLNVSWEIPQQFRPIAV